MDARAILQEKPDDRLVTASRCRRERVGVFSTLRMDIGVLVQAAK